MKIKKLINLIEIRFSIKSRIFVLLIIVFLFGSCFIPISLPDSVDQIYEQYNMLIDGQILFAPMLDTTTYLINADGTVNHTWASSYYPGLAVKWLGNGTILRTIQVDVGPGGGSGGGVQKVQWDGTVVWDFRYDTDEVLSHHDIKPLPNGNVLMIAWETKTRDEAIAAGRNPDYVSPLGLMPDHILEVQPTGPTSGEIVWEWHVWDHLIQDYDYSKDNYGVVTDHPELVDINYVTSNYQDLMHTNSIDYNEKFNQILISVYYFNEIWVIDHSTTTEEAAGHTGGKSGIGGDILYRWGNPKVYQRGNSGDQKLFVQHDAQWIKPGLPGEGNILIFNNGATRPGGHYSTVDEITPPVNDNGSYYLENGFAYGPPEQTWIYTANPPSSFYSGSISGAQRLANGNTLICSGETGKIFEVTPEGETVWQYNAGPLVFKVVYIPSEEPSEPNNPDLDCSGSLSWSNIKPGATVNGSFKIQNIGDAGSLLNWTVKTLSIAWGNWSFSPVSGKNLTPEDGQVTVQVSVVAPNEKNSGFQGYLKVENQGNPSDFGLIPVSLRTTKNIYVFHTPIYQFILKFKNLYSEILYNFLKHSV
jgi:hypothetical protein